MHKLVKSDPIFSISQDKQNYMANIDERKMKFARE